MNLDDMRSRVRRDLHDEDASNYRWTDDDLDRHIDRAVREFSLSVPLEAKATLTTSEGSREISIAGVTDLIAIEAVEYPVGTYPPVYVRFSTRADTLILEIDNAPVGDESVNVYYAGLHTLNSNSSTIPSSLEDMITTGAEAYAALEWASFATNRINVAGGETWKNYLVWGQDRLAAFATGLAKHGRKNAVRARQLYRPYRAVESQSTDWGP